MSAKRVGSDVQKRSGYSIAIGKGKEERRGRDRKSAEPEPTWNLKGRTSFLFCCSADGVGGSVFDPDAIFAMPTE